MTQLNEAITEAKGGNKALVPLCVFLPAPQVLAFVAALSTFQSSVSPTERTDKSCGKCTERRLSDGPVPVVGVMPPDSQLSPAAVSGAAAPEFPALRPARAATLETMTSPHLWSRQDSPNHGLASPGSRGRATSQLISGSPLPHVGGTPTSRRKRRPLLFRPRAPLAPEYHASSAAFRHAMVHGHSSSKLTLKLSCRRVVELAPIPMGGNCGFVAVSWALLIAGRLPSNDTSGGWVRRSLAAHVAAQPSFYAAKLVEWRVVAGGTEAAAASVKEFGRKVGEEGIKGHWLGQMWGFLEIFAIARAFRLNVELYTFDVTSQKVRMYHQQNEGKVTVAMLFSGQAEGGHFDLLLPTRRLSDLWKSKSKSKW